jgi:hypothetical protein
VKTSTKILLLGAATIALVVVVLAFLPAPRVSKDVSLSPNDPALLSKLGITTTDWDAIRKLASNERGLIVLSVSRVDSGTIEINFKAPDDRDNSQGGPSLRYNHSNGTWIKQLNFNGIWLVAKSG